MMLFLDILMNAPQELRVPFEVGEDFGFFLIAELTVEKGVDLSVADLGRHACFLTVPAPCTSASSNRRSASRPRDILDMNVPSGMPMTFAASA